MALGLAGIQRAENIGFIIKKGEATKYVGCNPHVLRVRRKNFFKPLDFLEKV